MHRTTHSSPLPEQIQREGFTASWLLSFWGGVCSYITLWLHLVSQSDWESGHQATRFCHCVTDPWLPCTVWGNVLRKDQIGSAVWRTVFFFFLHLSFIYWLTVAAVPWTWLQVPRFRLRRFNTASACSLCVCVLWWTVDVDLGWIPTSQTLSAGVIIVVF